MNLISYLLIFIFVNVIHIYSMESENSYKEVMREINKYSNIIKKEKNICLRMYGLDYAGEDKVYDGKIHLIDLGYSIDKKNELRRGKELILFNC